LRTQDKKAGLVECRLHFLTETHPLTYAVDGLQTYRSRPISCVGGRFIMLQVRVGCWWVI
jgi:hypothetical protein